MGFLRHKTKTSYLLFVFLFVLFGTFFFPQPAYAILGIFGGVADAIGKAIGWIIASFLLVIPTAILGIASIFLGWSIDPFFIRVPYTSGGVVDIGWPVVRDLANMGIVLALVAIGLATALRLQEYQARKTLPLLIGVALLINFTPVILGVIVDGANIAMNFFLEGLTGGQILGTVFSNISAIIAGDLGGFNFFNPIELLSFIFKILIIGMFMMFAALVFFLFAILFIMRRVVIWLLVILSPLAFVAYILPATRSFARMWWNQFWNWTIIGVFAAFFLWLGDQMIGLAAQGGLTGDVPSSGPGGLGVAGIFNDVAPYGVALIFLLLGFFVALSTSAMGAGGIMAGTQALGKTAGKAAGAFSVGVARGVPAVSQTEERIRKRLETTPGVGRLVGGPGAYEREKGKKMDELSKPFEKMAPADIRTAFRQRPLTHDDRLKQAGLFKVLQEKGELSDTERAYLPRAQQMGLDTNAILSRRLDWAPDVGQTIDQALARMTPLEFRQKVQPEALSNPEVVLRAQLDEAKFQELERRGKTTQKRQFKNTILTGVLPPAVAATLTPAELAILAARAMHVTTSPNWGV